MEEKPTEPDHKADADSDSDVAPENTTRIADMRQGDFPTCLGDGLIYLGGGM